MEIKKQMTKIISMIRMWEAAYDNLNKNFQTSETSRDLMDIAEVFAEDTLGRMPMGALFYRWYDNEHEENGIRDLLSKQGLNTDENYAIVYDVSFYCALREFSIT
jgi:hypothetical protein